MYCQSIYEHILCSLKELNLEKFIACQNYDHLCMYSGLSDNNPHSHTYVNDNFWFGGMRWERLGCMALLEEVYHYLWA